MPSFCKKIKLFSDFIKVLQLLGQNTKNPKRMNKFLEAADPNKKGVITFSKFIILMEIYKKKDNQV